MKSPLKAIVGLAATAFFLWLALKGVHWGEVVANLRDANLWLLGAAVLLSTLGIHIRAMRWRTLLVPVAPGIPFRPRMAGTAVGFAMNNLLPARVGEFARVVVCARLGRAPVPAVLGTIVIERVLDGLVCVGLLFAVIAFEGFPAGVQGVAEAEAAARVTAGIVLALGVVLLLLVVFPTRAVRVADAVAGKVLPERLRRPVVDALHAFLGGLGVLRDPKLLAQSVAWVLFQWLFLGVSFLLAFRAFGITEPGYLGALFLQSFVSIAVAIPSAPGFFGPFEAAARYGLALWGVDEARAVSFAIGLHVGGWLSVTLLGLWYVWTLGLSWKELGQADEKVETAVEADPALAPPGAGAGPGRRVRR